jgi:hypothetical protein
MGGLAVPARVSLSVVCVQVVGGQVPSGHSFRGLLQESFAAGVVVGRELVVRLLDLLLLGHRFAPVCGCHVLVPLTI